MLRGEAIDWLFSLHRFGMKLGLENIRVLTDALGRPQDRFDSVLVAGTNGKGSTAAMLHQVLLASGLRSGLYTSPHLVRTEERIRIGEREIGEAELAASLSEVRSTIEGLVASRALGAHPTFFEAITAAALLAFARARVEIAVLEVGLGGRFDATNVVTPILSVVTNIDLDHQEHLGSTRGAIAREKAGIFRRAVPALVGGGGDDRHRDGPRGGLRSALLGEARAGKRDDGTLKDRADVHADAETDRVDEETLGATRDVTAPDEAIDALRDVAALVGAKLILARDGCRMRVLDLPALDLPALGPPALDLPALGPAAMADSALDPAPRDPAPRNPAALGAAAGPAGGSVPRGLVLSIDTPVRSYPRIDCPLPGAHQADNVLLAVRAAELLSVARPAIDAAGIASGIAGARWPGRLEWIEGRPALLLDGAHNPAGAKVLAAYASSLPVRPVMVFGAMRDKDARAMLSALLPVAASAVFTRPPFERAADPGELAAIARALDPGGDHRVEADVATALSLARARAGPGGIVLVAGSLFLVGAVKETLEPGAMVSLEARSPAVVPLARAPSGSASPAGASPAATPTRSASPAGAPPASTPSGSASPAGASPAATPPGSASPAVAPPAATPPGSTSPTTTSPAATPTGAAARDAVASGAAPRRARSGGAR